MEKGKAISLIREYLQRSADPYWKLSERIQGREFELIIVIPCFEELHVEQTLQSLFDCDLPAKPVLVIAVINQSESLGKELSPDNLVCLSQIKVCEKKAPIGIEILPIIALKLPAKKAGVGLARKIGMDLAAQQFANQDLASGPIVCLDADCQVDPNYLLEVTGFFRSNPECPGASIYYEHPLDRENSSEIIQYETRLRYYNQALRWAGFPYAHQTVGSSMVVRAEAYTKQGGMNQRKAGEDFYFLHKIIPLGNFGEINTTRVIPSSRESNRVPFGTGRAISNQLNGQENLGIYYDLNSFIDLRSVLSEVKMNLNDMDQMLSAYTSFPVSYCDFVSEQEWQSKITEIFRHGKSIPTRSKRFFEWMDAFSILKFCHHCRDHFYPNSSLKRSVITLFDLLAMPMEGDQTESKEILEKLREIERNSGKR